MEASAVIKRREWLQSELFAHKKIVIAMGWGSVDNTSAAIVCDVISMQHWPTVTQC
jgi:hypothetical protein